MRMRMFGLLAVVVAAIGLATLSWPSGAQPAGAALRGVRSFDGIADVNARSVALFEEAGRVLTHPRCVNCHPVADRPLQGDSGRPHQPPIFGGVVGTGSASMPCATCHGQSNFTLVGTSVGSIPGNPKWHLAPREMAWQGKTLAAICSQLKDPSRNGGRNLAALVEHSAHDALVGWAWAPGAGRQPAPGTQELFGSLIGAWVETGAQCPA